MSNFFPNTATDDNVIQARFNPLARRQTRRSWQARLQRPFATLSAVVALVAATLAPNAAQAQTQAPSQERKVLIVLSSAHQLDLRDGKEYPGEVKFYAADALSEAGAHVDRIGAFQSNVIEDRELISGQQPFSSDAFVARLKQEKTLQNAS
jgi:putative intracellular protease/amidase